MTRPQRQRTPWDWRLKLYPLIVIPMMVYLNAAPQPSTAEDSTAPFAAASSQEGVGQGEVAVAAPVQGVNAKGAAYVWERNPKYPVIEFVMILTNERR